MTCRRFAIAFSAWALAATAPRAWAQAEVENVGRLAAVQPRPYHMAHELEFSLVYLPFDAFYQGLGPEVSYSFHISDRIAWEVVRGYYSFDFQTNLRARLETNFPTVLEPTATEEIQYSLSSSLIWSPAYGKFALFNRSVTQGEGFLLLGGTLARLTNSFKPGPSLGGGLRFFISQLVSARFDLRYSALIDLQGLRLTHVIALSLGFSLDLGTPPAPRRGSIVGSRD
jgi:outer membrane beta-barrel protein